MLKYFEQNFGDEGEAGMLNAEFYQLSYGVNLFLKISKIFLRAHFIIYQKCLFKRQLSLAGYHQSSVPRELKPTPSQNLLKPISL